MDELSGQIRSAGGRDLDGDLMCDEEGCTRLGGFRTTAALGAHKWRAHGIPGDGGTSLAERPSRQPEARAAERQREREAYGVAPPLRRNLPVTCSECGRIFGMQGTGGPQGFGGHLTNAHVDGELQRLCPVTRQPARGIQEPDIPEYQQPRQDEPVANLMTEHERDDEPGDAEPIEDEIEVEATTGVWAALDQDRADVLAAYAYVNETTGEEYVTALLCDALDALADDNDVALLVELRQKFRSRAC